MRDRVMHGLGTDEEYVIEKGGVAMHWRRPLRIDEINQMAPTEDVRRREGRT